MARTAEYLAAAKAKMCPSMAEECATTEAKVRPPQSADKNQNMDSTPGKFLVRSVTSTSQLFTHLRIRNSCASRGDASQRRRHKMPGQQNGYVQALTSNALALEST